MATDQAEKIRENRLRNMAGRQGLRVVKSRRRDPRALDYGAYWVVDPNTNSLVAGSSNYGLSIDELEEYLTEEKQ